jgi:hypothetical protein
MSQSPTDLLIDQFEANMAVSRDMLALAEVEPVVAGHAGQPKPHPGFAVSVKCAEVALRLHAELRRAGALTAGSGDAFDDLAAARNGRPPSAPG